MMEIILTTNEIELDECAKLMSQSEPFITLKIDYERCKLAVRGEYKEVYLAKQNNEFVGFVVLSYFGVLRGYIQTICIKPEYRSKGIGTALLKFSEEKMLKEFANVFMCVSSFNHRAQKLYYSLGFEKIGMLTDHFVKGYDEYILRKQGCPITEFKQA
jgi:ribosomal protein S18 acetylase RimI-like enzyme